MARIAIAGFLHETNTFAPVKALWADFLRDEGWPGLTHGSAIFERMAGRNIGVAGFIEAARNAGHDLLPIAWSAAVPSAHVSEDAFERMSEIILTGLKAAEPFDAVYLDLHGAMVCEHLEDGEGVLLQRVRAAIGPQRPLVASLDLHSNTTDTMVQQADGLIAYRTYPHVDMAETGARSAHYLERLLGNYQPPQRARQTLPFLLPLRTQCTMAEPMDRFYRQLAALEQTPGVTMMSLTPGFPPADIYDCGPAIVAYGDDGAAVNAVCRQLCDEMTAAEAEFDAPFLNPEQAVARALAVNSGKPVVLADVQDNSGAGATSDTTGLLAAMVKAGAEKTALGLMVDPQVAQMAHQAGLGAEMNIAVGGKIFTEGDPPFQGRFTVKALSQGQFRCTGPMFGGSDVDIGASANLTIGGVELLVSSGRMQLADQAIFRNLAVEPREMRILGVKSSVHFRADFDPIAHEILLVEAPGAFIDRPERLPYQNLRPQIRRQLNG